MNTIIFQDDAKIEWSKIDDTTWLLASTVGPDVHRFELQEVLTPKGNEGVDVFSWSMNGYEVEGIQKTGNLYKLLDSKEYHELLMAELLKARKLNGECLTVTGRTLGENLADRKILDERVIRPYDQPLKERAGFIVLSGNLFDSGLLKTSVIGEAFRRKYLERPGNPNAWEGTAIVFDGPEDYHEHINDPDLPVGEDSLLFIRYCGPVGYPGSAEVVNMLPPDRMVKLGISTLPCIGDGRQSGTSASPSILNASPEAAVGGGLALLKTGDRVRIDLNKRTIDMLVGDDELARRREAWQPPELYHQTPWQEIYRGTVGQLATGACLELAVKYQGVRRNIPRHSH